MDPSDYLAANKEQAAEPSVSPSPCPVPPPDDGMRQGSPNPSSGPLPRRRRRSIPAVNVTQLMHLAGGLDIAVAISAADAHTDSLNESVPERISFGPDWEVSSERAGDESRRIGHKRPILIALQISLQ